MKIYIAAFFDTRERLYPYIERLEAAGHEITASWLRERPEATYKAVTDGYRLACALYDAEEIGRSSIFILDTIDETPRGGREVEFGMAIKQGIPVFLVGPKRNVFHQLAFRCFESWDALMQSLASIHR